MARTEHLPIYKTSHDLCLYLEQVVQGFSRYHKYTDGTDLRDGARRVLRLVVRANSRQDTVAALLAMCEELEELKVLLRLCQDVQAFPNFNSFGHATELVTVPFIVPAQLLEQTLRQDPSNLAPLKMRLKD